MSLFAAAAHAAVLAMTLQLSPAPNPSPPPTAPTAQPAAAFSADEQLWLEVTLDDQVLTSELDVYTGRGGVYLPLGELARLLDLAVVVLPPERRAEGWVIAREREVALDVPRGLALANGREFAVSPLDAVFFQDEIYVRAELLGRLLPVTAVADASSQTLALTAREPLPAQQRARRAGARRGLGQGGGDPDALRVETPYNWFTAPSVDFSLDTGLSNRAPQESVRYDLRLGGDLARAGFQLFAGSDEQGGLSTVRVLLERKDPDGRIAGPFGATRSAIGDVFTPALALGARSTEGRGVVSTSAPIEQVSAFTRLDLRGELPLGYEVELYVNEVLRGSQATPVEGRYAFQDVALSYGLNTVRLVLYGPRGERREEVRRINFGTSQLAAGASVFRFGVVQQGSPLLDLRRGDGDDPLFDLPGEGELRFVGGLDYGLNSTLTLSMGAAHFTPPSGGARSLGTAGLRTSLAGLALQGDLALDDRGGTALAAAVAGRFRGVGYVARHAEYGGGFIDELQPRGAFATNALVRASDLFLDSQLSVRGVGSVPVSLETHRDERADGSTFIKVDGRASAALNRYFVSTAFGYERETGSAVGADRFAGSFDVATRLRGDWQVRAGVGYDAVPRLRMSSAFLAVDRDIGDRQALRLAASRSFGEGSDTVLQGASIWRFNAFDLALSAGYAARDNAFRVGLQFAFGLAYDPWRRRYRAVRPGVAAGGNVAFESYVDRNGDGVRQADEASVPGLIVEGGLRNGTTDADGRLLVTGLGDGALTQLRVDPESLDDPYLSGAAETFEIVPRPGRLARVQNPLRTTGEVEVRMLLARSGGEAVGLSAVQVELADASGRMIAEGRSEYDGTILFEGLVPGAYALRLRPEQAQRLRLRLSAPVDIVVPAGGGFVGGVSARMESVP